MTKTSLKKAPTPLLGLNDRLAAIGIMMSARSLSPGEVESEDIEAVLADAMIELSRSTVELRLFGPLLSWVAEHGSAVIVEKLIKILRARAGEGADVSHAALVGKFAQTKGHKRWSTVVENFAPTQRPLRIFGPADLAVSLLALRGEEEWARGSGFRIPKGAAVTQAKWALSRQSLAKRNRRYRNRLIYGAQWRADIITAYQLGARTPTEASQMSGASYEPCYRVKSELEAAGVF